MTGYRPSNATEFFIFNERWCVNCIKESGCTILTGAMWGKSPKQWLNDDKGPRCTSFQDHRPERNYRCRETPDLFTGNKTP